MLLWDVRRTMIVTRMKAVIMLTECVEEYVLQLLVPKMLIVKEDIINLSANAQAILEATRMLDVFKILKSHPFLNANVKKIPTAEAT